MDPRAIVGAAVDTIAGGIPDDIRADYLACYDGDRFAESMRYARRYPEELPVLAGLLPQITVPVTINNGSHDRVVPLRKRRVPRPAAAHQPPRDHRCRALRLGGGSGEVRLGCPRLRHRQLAMSSASPVPRNARASQQPRTGGTSRRLPRLPVLVQWLMTRFLRAFQFRELKHALAGLQGPGNEHDAADVPAGDRFAARRTQGGAKGPGAPARRQEWRAEWIVGVP